MKVILLLRGHERSTFKTKTLKKFVNKLHKKFGNSLLIYVHTWNVNEANTSWRNLNLERNSISEKDIIDYFDYSNIKYFIDDEEKMEIYGKINVHIGSMPIYNWKLMWAGQNKIIEFISEEYIDQNPFIINMRIDFFKCNTTQKFKITVNNVLQKCENAIKNYNKLTFYHENGEYDGIDNLIFGDLSKMKDLINHFHFKLDSFYKKYDFCFFHENIVYFEAQKINNTFQEPNKLEYYSNIIVNQFVN